MKRRIVPATDSGTTSATRRVSTLKLPLRSLTGGPPGAVAGALGRAFAAEQTLQQEGRLTVDATFFERLGLFAEEEARDAG